MLAPLRDIHVWIVTPQGQVRTYRTGYQYNGNMNAVLAQLDERTVCGEYAVVGKTKPDGFGYFLMRRQGAANEADVQKAIDAIRRLSDAPGFVVDLRAANGGSEPLALEIARQFCANETVYAKSKRRSGPGHDEFGLDSQRRLPATKGAYTRPVVCLIGPGAVSSGEGFVKMMRSLPHVTPVGLPTRGASGNPSGFNLQGAGLSIFFSRWVDMMPDGKTFEGVGIPPGVKVEFSVADYANGDPTFARGLEILRQKIAN